MEERVRRTAKFSWVIGGVLAALASSGPVAALADEAFPSRPITLVVPSLPGNYPDTVARVFGKRLEEALGKPVVVENKPGGAGMVGTDRVLSSGSDGHTLLVGDPQQWGVAPNTVKVSFDPVKDFAPLSILAVSPMFLVVNASLNVSTVPELISLVKKNPDKFKYGTPGIASIHHLVWETLKAEEKLDILHVPYKGGAQTVPALIAGEVDMIFQTLPSISAHLGQGKIRILGIAVSARSPIAPDVPTFAEQGLPSMDFPVPIIMVAPGGTPPAIQAKLSAEFQKAAKHPDVAEQFRKMSIMTVGSTAEEARAFILSDMKKFARAAAAAGLTRN
jgi:tripartite-type tricarboxylate transporter receptor subunit TctC